MPDYQHNSETGRHVPSGPPPGVVLDRNEILVQLEEFARDPGRRLFILTGMHGIGKTAVAAELARRATGQKLFDETIWVDCRREERSADAFVGLLHSRLGSGEHPEFVALLREDSRDDQWVRWLENTFLGELGRRRYLVILDDFQNWVDEKTIQVADDAVRRALLAAASGSHHSKILLITEHRAPLAIDVLNLPFGVIEEEELFGLPSDQAIQMLIEDGMSGVSAALLQRAAETFDCSPLALRLFAHFVTREHHDPAELLEAHGTSTVLESLVGRLLGGLSPQARDTVELLALFRRPVKVSDLEAAGFDCGLDVRSLADRLIVRRRPDGVLLEPLFRAHTLACLQQDRRGLLHERAASFWGSLSSDDGGSPDSLDALWPALERAFHFGQAGLWTEAADTLAPAAIELLRLGYSDVAGEETAVVLPQIDDSDAKARLLIIAGRVADSRGRYDDAAERFSEAIGQESGCAETLAEAQYRLGRVRSAQCRFGDAVEWLTRAIDTARRHDTREMEARAVLSLAWTERQRGEDQDAVRARFREALVVAERAKDARTQSEAHRQLGFLAWDAFGNNSEAKSHYECALELGPTHNDTKEICGIQTDLTYLYAEWGEFLKARESGEAAIELCERSGNGYALANAYWNMGNLHERQGQWKEALEWFEKSRRQFERSGNATGLPRAWLRIGRARNALGDDWAAQEALLVARRLCQDGSLTHLLQDVEEEIDRQAQKDSDEASSSRGQLSVPSHITHINIERVEEMDTGPRINVGGDAIINIDALLENVTQTINKAPALPNEKQQELTALVTELKTELDKIKAERAEECEAIAQALDQAVEKASKPKPKKSLLEFSAKGLKDAAQLVADVAPSLVTTATKIAGLLVGLG